MVLLLKLLLSIIIKVFKEGGPLAVTVFQEAPHLYTQYGQKRKS